MGFLGVRIDEDLEEAIKKTGRPASSVVRDALRAYLELDRPPISPEHEYLVREFERLLDEKLTVSRKALNAVKHPPTTPTTESVLNTVKHKAQKRPSKDERLRKALKAILGFFDEGIEPLVGEVAERAGDSPGGLGMILGKAGVRTKPTARGERRGRLYTFEMRPQIEGLLENGELEERAG
jgi:hypothetical protein